MGINIVGDIFDDLTGVSSAERGIKAANKATQKAILEARGVLSDANAQGTSLLGENLEGNRQALLDAFNNSQAFLTQGTTGAIDALKGASQGSIDAITGANQNAINTLNPLASLFNADEFSRGLSVEGVGRTLSDFSDPTGAFKGLFDQRQRSATDALSAAGLNRSGRAAEEASNIDFETALGLSNDLFGRQASSPALQAIQNISNIQQGEGTDIANILQSTGGDISGLLNALGINQASGAQGFGADSINLEDKATTDLLNLILGGASNEANLITGAGASEAESLQAIGGLRGQVVGPLLEAAIGGAAKVAAAGQ